MRYLFSVLASTIFCFNVAGQNVQTIADSNNLFALNLYSQLCKEKQGNLFLSPFSISTALAMTYAGARNETEKQMRDVLHFNLVQDSFHTQYKSYLDKIASDTGKNVTIEIANSIWIANGCKIYKHFSEVVRNDYNSESKNVYFAQHTEEVRQEINSWVEHKTHDKIQDLIAKGMIEPSTRLVLVNAIYFNGKWDMPFSKDSTRLDTFFGESVAIPKPCFMNKTGHYKYYEDTLLQAIELPYAGGRTSMIVFLPQRARNIKEVENNLDSKYYSRIVTTLSPEKVKLELPKFKTTTEFELSHVLSAMGMPDAFGAADFSGITKEKLSISAVIHKAFIDVNEQGTEAAAATGIIMKLTAVRPSPKAYSFIANHPFIFIIKDNATGSILFMGKIADLPKE